MFAYERSALKMLYFEEVKAEESQELDDANSWRDTLRKKFSNRREMMNLSYVSYLCIPFLSNFCCCLMKGCRESDNWYSRGKKTIAKFEIAKEKLNSEIDMKEVVRFCRISSFL